MRLGAIFSAIIIIALTSLVSPHMVLPASAQESCDARCTRFCQSAQSKGYCMMQCSKNCRMK
jgi:hypothetical protein